MKRVLTKKEFHTRGHKVELETGVIGRLVRIIKKNDDKGDKVSNN